MNIEEKDHCIFRGPEVLPSFMKCIKDIEDKIDNEAADIAEKYIEKHGTISWSEMERKLGIDSE